MTHDFKEVQQEWIQPVILVLSFLKKSDTSELSDVHLLETEGSTWMFCPFGVLSTALDAPNVSVRFRKIFIFCTVIN